jgi:Tfp pilus assembly protein PilN
MDARSSQSSLVCFSVLSVPLLLQQQLERVSAACQNVQFMDEKLDHLKQTQNTYEAKVTGTR